MPVPTASCFCGAVRIAFDLEKSDPVLSFICNCTDCRKITASTFATNFVVSTKCLTFESGENLLTAYKREHGIASGNTMTSCFCSKCGTLMYRISSGFPDHRVMRVGTVDDFELHQTVLKPTVEQFTKDRVNWLTGATGVKQVEGNVIGVTDPSKI